MQSNFGYINPTLVQSQITTQITNKNKQTKYNETTLIIYNNTLIHDYTLG